MRKSILSFGEILFDIFPDAKRLGGAPFNFASHLHAFKQTIIFLSRIGMDPNGREIESILEQRKFPHKYVQLDHSKPTGYVDITLSEKGNAEYSITREVAWDYIILSKKLKNRIKKNIDLVYFGTLAQRSPRSRDTLSQVLSVLPEECLVMCDLNLRQDFYNIEIIHDSFVRSDILKLNEDELEVVKDLFVPLKSEQEFADWLCEKFAVSHLCITRGEKGATLYRQGKAIESPDSNARSAVKVKNTVGAGDAFASVLALGILQGWKEETILERAAAFAQKICTEPGALPHNKEFYSDFMTENNIELV